MAVRDIIIRRGSRGKEVKEGPALLFGPTSDRRHRVGSDVDRVTGDVDLYEINSSPCGIPGEGGTPPGNYFWVISPWKEKGFTKYIRAIRWVSVIILRADGTPELLFRKSTPATDRKFVIQAPGGVPFEVKTGERLFLSVERLGGTSCIQYMLSLDADVVGSDGNMLPEGGDNCWKPDGGVNNPDGGTNTLLPGGGGNLRPDGGGTNTLLPEGGGHEGGSDIPPIGGGHGGVAPPMVELDEDDKAWDLIQRPEIDA